MEIVIIAAVAENGAIGKNGSIPWDLPEDRKRFREVTWGHPVIMGSRTYRSIGKPLEGRLNIVLSHGQMDGVEGITVAHSIEEAFRIAEQSGAETCYVIGGEQVYRQALKYADRLDITLVHTQIEGADAFFPDKTFDI